MVTVLRDGAFRVVIFVNDHQPAHVHVFGDGELKIDISRPGRVKLVWADRMSKPDVRRAMLIVTKMQVILLERWREIHGDTD